MPDLSGSSWMSRQFGIIPGIEEKSSVFIQPFFWKSLSGLYHALIFLFSNIKKN